MSPKVEPFEVKVAEEVLDDLKRRLADTRWPDELPGVGWDYGSNMDYIKELCEYWRTSFDWRAAEAKINSFANFRSEVDGLNIHFIHERGKGPNPIPIVITHGWPSTVSEMLKIIPLLSDPVSHGGDAADSFDVIAPSLPGYGFSDRTNDRGYSNQRIGDLWAKLMTENLGYDKFAAHGGDWGASITARLGYAHADKLHGIHVTSASALPYTGPGTPELTVREKEYLAAREQWRNDEGGYAHIQGTKPQTLSYGLNDSPAGLAAWIVEKYRTWSDCQGDVESVYTKDELLTNISIYWVTQTISSSVRIYYESQRHPLQIGEGERIESPSAIALFPKDISYPPREWVERGYNVQRFNEFGHGGHFAALEEPEVLVEDIRGFFRSFR